MIAAIYADKSDHADDDAVGVRGGRMSDEVGELHRIIRAAVRDMLDAYRLEARAGLLFSAGGVIELPAAPKFYSLSNAFLLRRLTAGDAGADTARPSRSWALRGRCGGAVLASHAH
jgi:hypothetical protein